MPANADHGNPEQAALQRELKKLQVLYQLASALTADHTLDENLLLIVENSRGLLSADTSYIALRDPSLEDIYIRASSGIRTVEFKEMRIPIGRGLGGLVAETRQGLIVNDYFSDSRYARAVDPIVEAEGLLSGMAVPIQMGEENLGVLYVFNRTTTDFLQQDLDTLLSIGNLAAVAISHARVARSLELAGQELESRVAQRTASLREANRRLTTEIEQRKKTQEAFRQSEQNLRALFERSQDGILTLDTERLVTDCNSAFLRMFGFNRSEIVGHSIMNIYKRRDEFERFGRIVYPVVSKEGFWRGEWVFFRKDGTPITTEPSISTLTKPGEGIYGYVSIIRDISQRKLAETALRQSEEKFYKAFHASPDWGSISTIKEGRYLEVNGAYCQGCGRSREDVLGRTSTEVGLWADTADRDRGIEIIKQKGHLSNFEVTFRHKDGSDILALWSAEIIKLGDQDCLLSTVTDITERKRTEQALRQSEKKYRDLFNNITDFIYTHDLKGRFINFNPAVVKALGYTEEELAGQPISQFMLPKYRQDFEKNYLEEINRKGHSRGTSVYVASDGREIYTEYRSVLVKQQGKPAYVSGSGREVTERILAEREMKMLQSQLQQAQKMEAIGTLAGGVAHDFNNILQAMEGYMELLGVSRSLGESDRSHLAQIHRAVNRASYLVKQLLTFSRKVEPELIKLDLNLVVVQTVRLLERTIPKMITINTHLSPSLPAIWGDPTQLEQVLINLATNARDAMSHGGSLTIQTSQVTVRRDYSDQKLGMKPGPHVLLMISDTGQGMSHEELEHIFDPFYTTKELGQGTGLGLSTVFGIVRAHGGYINCISEIGRGTIFKVYLPLGYEPDNQRQVSDPEDSTAPEATDGRETILVVDDELPILEMSREILLHYGYKVLTADCCEAALELFQESEGMIDLVVLDLGMPGLGGHVCLERFLELDPQMKIIVASGYTAEGQIKDTIQAGAKDFLTKPFSLNKLVKKVQAVLKD